MKKQKMERLDGHLFQPLTAKESEVLCGGQVHTDHISLFPTADPTSPDLIRDIG